MYTFQTTLLISCFILFTTKHTAAESGYSLTTAEDYLVPGYHTLLTNAQKPSKSLHTTCLHLGEDNIIEGEPLSELQDQLKTLYLSWASVQHIQFGPMAYLKRKERFQYWPDKHKVGGKQIRRLINSSTKLPDAEEIAEKSVAVQGLPALETLLFSSSKKIAKRQCLLASTISKNLHAIAQENYSLWTEEPVNFSKEFKIEKYNSGVFNSQKDIDSEFFNSIRTQLRIIEHLKIPDLNTKKKVSFRNLEAWKSNISLDIIKENIASLKKHDQHAFYQSLEAIDPKSAHDINNAFDNAMAAINKIPEPLSTTLREKNATQEINQARKKIKDLITTVNIELTNNLKLQSAFNSLDGD